MILNPDVGNDRGAIGTAEDEDMALEVVFRPLGTGECVRLNVAVDAKLEREHRKFLPVQRRMQRAREYISDR